MDVSSGGGGGGDGEGGDEGGGDGDAGDAGGGGDEGGGDGGAGEAGGGLGPTVQVTCVVMVGLATVAPRWQVGSMFSALAQRVPSVPVICSTFIIPWSSCWRMWQWIT